ncbi:MAG: primosomal protein N' [Mogibacterium sp.]|nr:primosomal protein N' [Mogibacterium sp.]
MQYINVVIDNKSTHTDTFFTYAAPDEVTKGARLTVPFGTRKKPVDAYCVGTGAEISIDPAKIKEISSVDPDRSLNPEMIDTAVWMRKRYGIRYIDAIKMFAAPGKREPKHKEPQHGITVNDPGYELSEDQQVAADKITDAIRNNTFRAFLIKGVTNSGKTEVYMRAAEQALALGKTAIVLLPEIALAEQVRKRFEDRFGKGSVATLHSRLSKSAKHGEWLRIRRGEAKIVIGARTSVFAPIDNIGAVIIDEEHESTFKSDHTPKYETVDIAYRRAREYNAVLVLGSATPSVVSYYRASSGVYELIEMNRRIGDSIMPELEIVDMRKETLAGNTSVISRQLAEEMDASLRKKEQVILFLNRRGFSTQILCPDCGYRMTCPDCGITLTYHKSAGAAVCHYCGRKFALPDKCPDCGNKFIKYVGAGTEKVEETVKSIWPDANVARFDLDTATSSEDASTVIEDFQAGKTDILVGTQILAKGLDFRNVGLVGVINADVSLNIPDYRSSERTYQLITQVAGRAGRAGGSSRVLIQTYDPESDVLHEAARGDYESFYEAELLHRNIMNYPPYSDIIAVGLVSDSQDEAMQMAESFRERLLSLRSAPKDARIMKPRLDERRTDGKARAMFIIKAPQGSRGGYVREYMEFRDKLTESKSKCFIEIDINPYSTF